MHKPSRLRRIQAWLTSSMLILDWPSECKVCGRKGQESEIRKHVILDHSDEYDFARKHGHLPESPADA